MNGTEALLKHRQNDLETEADVARAENEGMLGCGNTLRPSGEKPPRIPVDFDARAEERAAGEGMWKGKR